MVSPPIALLAYFFGAMFVGVVQASHQEESQRALVAHFLWFSGMIFGLIVLTALRRGRPFVLSSVNDIRKLGGLSGNRDLILIFIILGIVSVALTFLMLGRVPLLIGFETAISGSGDLTMHQARRMNTITHRAGDTFYFGQGYLRQIYTVVAPVFCAAFYLLMKMGPVPSDRGVRLALLLFGLFFLFGALNGQIWISLTVGVYFGLVAVLVMVWQGRRQVVGRLLLRGLRYYIYLISFVFAYRLFQILGGRHVEGGWIGSTVKRIWSYDRIRLFELFPDVYPFRWGSTWINDLRGILPGPLESFAYESHYLIHGGAWGFTASPGIIASSYLNFGYVGVFFVAFAFTVLFCLIFTWLVGCNSAVRVALGALVSVRFAFGLPGDFAPYIVDLLTIIAILVSYILGNSVIRIFSRRTRSFA